MVLKHQVSYPKTGGFLFTNIVQVSSGYVGQVLLVIQPIPYKTLIVLREWAVTNNTVRPPLNNSWGGV